MKNNLTTDNLVSAMKPTLGDPFDRSSGARKKFGKLAQDNDIMPYGSAQAYLSRFLNGSDMSEKEISKLSKVMEVIESGNFETKITTTSSTTVEFKPIAKIESPQEPLGEDILKSIKDSFYTFEQLVRAMMVEGSGIDSIITSGTPGMGKTFTVTKVLNEVMGEGKYEIIGGKATPLEIFKKLFLNRNGGVLVFDDIDVFSDMNLLNIFKKALESGGGPRKVDNLTSAKALEEFAEKEGVDVEEVKSFDFQGKIIFLTNLDINNEIKKGLKLSSHLSAIRSRGYYVDLCLPTTTEKVVWVSHVIENGLADKKDLSFFETREILEFVSEHSETFMELDLRSAEKIINFKQTFPDTWKVMAKASLTEKVS